MYFFKYSSANISGIIKLLDSCLLDHVTEAWPCSPLAGRDRSRTPAASGAGHPAGAGMAGPLPALSNSLHEQAFSSFNFGSAL